MPNPEFWYEHLASVTTMHGPGVTIALVRSSRVVHSLLLTGPSEQGDGTRDQGPLVWVDSAPENGAQQLDPTRVFNPVYQELVPHELPEELRPGLCVLLTGSCFEHHFSAVLSLYRDRAIPSRVVLDVDVADRCRAPIAKLAATYHVHYQGAVHATLGARPGALAWDFGPRGDATLEFLALPPATIGEPSPSPRSTVQVDAVIDPRSHTQRLHYRWRWTS